MNKRITSIVLSLVMLFTMLATAVPVLAATPVELKVTADTTSANPGDTINYKVSVGAVTDMGGLEFKLDIPSGLTVDDSSISIPDGLETIIDSDGPIIVPTRSNRYYWLYSAQLTGYTGTSDLVILTFSCKVDDGTTGTKTVSIKEVVLIDQSVDDMPFNVTGADVNVTAAPVSVTGVTIDETLSVNIGQTKTPSFTVAPAEATNKTVSFTSDNPAVATVNATTGEVTGVKKGTATITVKTADGNFTDTCTVTVSCTHTNKSTVPAQDSTCTVKGWDEYKKCDDCGQLFDTSDVEIDEIPFLNLANHTGGTATCTAKAVCSVCHQPYGNYAAHSYTAETKKAEALKTAGNCRDKAVYYYSCSVCGNVEHNDAHTFLGDKNASVHVGGTSTVNASEADHKNQVDGYTGDTKCLGCGEIIATGTSIPAGAHTPSSTWNNDGTYHWKECTTMGCGVVIDGSKAAHSSTGSNIATCQHKAVCDVCHVEYGALAAHNPASGWSSDASGHWHACQTAGCTEKCGFAAHTPDHEGGATYDYAVKCSVCNYVIEPQLEAGNIRIEVPFKLDVKKTGEMDPGKETFKFVVERFGAPVDVVLVQDTIETNGEKTYEGKFIFTIGANQAGNLSEGFVIRQVKGNAEGWTYDETKFYAMPMFADTYTNVAGWRFLNYDENAELDYNNPIEEISFTNSYNAKKPVTPPAPQEPDPPKSPETGDSSMTGLWIALLFVSGAGVAGTTLYSRKRKSVK